MDPVFFEALKTELGPLISNQGQMKAYRLLLEATQLLAKAILSGDKVVEGQATVAQQSAILALKLSMTLTGQVCDVPDDVGGEAVRDFKTPPAEFEEGALYEHLLGELRQQESAEALQMWYVANKVGLDRIVSRMRRNVLFDTLRETRIRLSL